MAPHPSYKPLLGLNGYTHTGPDGLVSIDIEGMLTDLVAMVKSNGAPRDEFLEWVGETYDRVKVKDRKANQLKS